jgi:nitrate reductase NapE component
MTKVAERMQLPFSSAMAKVRTLIKKDGIADHAFVYVWLFHVMALSASMYGFQVWSTPFLQKAEQTAQSKSCSVL